MFEYVRAWNRIKVGAVERKRRVFCFSLNFFSIPKKLNTTPRIIGFLTKCKSRALLIEMTVFCRKQIVLE